MSFSASTPNTSIGGTFGPPEIKLFKADSNSLDPMGVWKRINLIKTLKLEKFDKLKHNARVWIGQLKTAIVNVSGLIDTHALGVFPLALTLNGSKW